LRTRSGDKDESSLGDIQKLEDFIWDIIHSSLYL
jgi:hypothetical protein